MQIDPLPPPQVPFEGARVQRENHHRADIEAFGTTAGCLGFLRSDLESELKPPCRVRIEERLRMTPEGAERLDRRSEVLRKALAKEVERNIRRRAETGSAAGEMAVPRESKDAPIPPDSDSEKRRAMNAATVDASSSGLQMGGSRAVAETLTPRDSMADRSRMDFQGEEKDESRNSNAKKMRRRIMTKTSSEE